MDPNLIAQNVGRSRLRAIAAVSTVVLLLVVAGLAWTRIDSEQNVPPPTTVDLYPDTGPVVVTSPPAAPEAVDKPVPSWFDCSPDSVAGLEPLDVFAAIAAADEPIEVNRDDDLPVRLNCVVAGESGTLVISLVDPAVALPDDTGVGPIAVGDRTGRMLRREPRFDDEELTEPGEGADTLVGLAIPDVGDWTFTVVAAANSAGEAPLEPDLVSLAERILADR